MIANETEATRLSATDLDSLLAIVTGSVHVSFIPSNHWEYRDDLKAVLYPRRGLLEGHAMAAAGQIYQKGGYALHSQGKGDPWRSVDRAVTRARRATKIESIAPKSAFAVLISLEEERVENQQREKFPALGDYSLPRRDRAYREPSYIVDRTTVATKSPDGDVNKKTGIPEYWKRAAIAAKLVASRALSREELPPDMPWSDSTCDLAVSAAEAPTLDTMLPIYERLVAAICEARIAAADPPKPKKQPQPSPNEDRGEDSEESKNSDGSSESGQPSNKDEKPTEKSAQGDSSTTSDEQKSEHRDDAEKTDSADENKQSKDEAVSQSNPADESSGPPTSSETSTERPVSDEEQIEDSEATKNAKRIIERETAETTPQSPRETVDFIAGDASPDSPSADGIAERIEEQPSPNKRNQRETRPTEIIGSDLSWDGVRATVSNIINPLRRAVTQYFIDNETDVMEKRLRRGQYDVAQRLADSFQGITRREVCRKRTLPGIKSIDVYLLVDISGSMSSQVEGTTVDYRVFGTNPNARWMMALRMVVAFTEVFKSIEGVRFAVGIHDSIYEPVKEFAERLGESTKAKILAKIGYRGSTSADEAYSEVRKRFKRSDAPTKILIHLTDGEIQNGYSSKNSKESVDKIIPELERDGVEIVVLTVGMTATQVRRLVGDHRADEVTDANIGQVLAKHLKRTIIT